MSFGKHARACLWMTAAAVATACAGSSRPVAKRPFVKPQCAGVPDDARGVSFDKNVAEHTIMRVDLEDCKVGEGAIGAGTV